MIKKIFALFLGLGLVVWPTFSVKASDLTNTENFLKGNYTSLDPDTQDWMAMGLGSVGVSVTVNKTTSTNVLDLARNSLAFDAQNQSPTTQISTLESLYNNGQFGATGAVNNDVFALLAIERTDPNWIASHSEAFQTIINNQNSNGSFDFSAGGGGDGDITSAAIWALHFDSTSSGTNSLNKAFGYVSSLENSDGGFSFLSGESSNTASTSWALLAYQSLGKTNTQAANYLINTMQSNGAWLVNGSSDNLNTAYALMALSGQGMPIVFKAQAVTSPSTLGGNSPSNPASGNSNSPKSSSPTLAGVTKAPSAISGNTSPIDSTKNIPAQSSKKLVPIRVIEKVNTVQTVAPATGACMASASAQAIQAGNDASSASSSASTQVICN